ncbi:coiled-coil domain-containing protein 152 isoform X2 [Callorhinchus milii]|nr:coiled-coil domain-containing protein 152 isoform X2 [Callorhinchus milii]|eukprot:gi/632967079/ref/XP_007899780.1/ PREDICTED: coiled-coil domain-containing protein 152 isoform X2 [Callorhinchus milii]
MRKVAHAANLDKLVENFAVLEQKIAKTQGWTNLLDIQLEETKRLLKLAQTKESCMKEECTMLHRMIEGLQSTIQNQCDVRDENEQFKKCIQVLEQKIQVAEEEKKSCVEMLVTEMKTMEQKHKVELAEIQQDISRKFEIKETEINGIIDKKQTEILELNRQLRFQEREKQSEIIKLQMEFNSKLVRIQSTSVKSPHQDSSALPQNIFKRKLMHLQEEKNREISALRQTIQELEQQLSGSQDNRLKRRRF